MQPYVVTARKWPSVRQGERPQEKPNLLAPWFWTFSLQNCEKINVCCLSRTVCAILLGHPWKTNTDSNLKILHDISVASWEARRKFSQLSSINNKLQSTMPREGPNSCSLLSKYKSDYELNKCKIKRIQEPCKAY